MTEKTIQITNKLGLHARAAAKLSHLSNTFDSNIYLVYKDDKINAKSLLGILTLGASVGNNITITASGKDEKIAVKKITDLFGKKFDEEK